MKINFDRLPLILSEEIIRELLIIYDEARQSSEWREVSGKLSDDQIWQVLRAVAERDEKNAHEEWLHSSQEGIGLSEVDERSKSRKDWKGKKKLGELLTELRVKLMGEY